MISDLDRAELPRPASRWPLLVVTGLCVAAFIGVAVSGTADAPPAPVTAVAVPTPAALEPRRAPAPTQGAVVRPASLGLGLPAPLYKSVARAPSSGTTGLSPADEEALLQLRYRLPDDRVAVLVRVPTTDPLRGVNPASYTADSVPLRGTQARLLSGRTGVETILLWTEDGRSYQLHSSVHSVAELVQIAEQLR